MKKLIAFLLAALLLVGVTACGDDTHKTEEDTPSTTVTTQPSASTPSEGGDPTAPTESTQSTEALPTGATVPIGTKPTTGATTRPSGTASTTADSTTQTQPTGTVTTEAPTTTRTEPEDPNVGGSTSATTTNTTTTASPTTTPTTAKPTEPQGPYIVLPAVGSDIDVTNKKDRIRVSAVAAWFNDDGTIGVQLTFRNYTSNWITEETDYVNYVCYDKDGDVVQGVTRLNIGVIDTKKHVEKTFEFSVPADTAEVRITRSKITYWTEWA